MNRARVFGRVLMLLCLTEAGFVGLGCQVQQADDEADQGPSGLLNWEEDLVDVSFLDPSGDAVDGGGQLEPTGCRPCKESEYPQELECATIICKDKCERTVLKGAEACDDGDPCTTDICDLETHTCKYTWASAGVPCGDGEGDGDPCTTADQCNGWGECVGTPIDCSDGPCGYAGTPVAISDTCFCKPDIPKGVCVFSEGMLPQCQPVNGGFPTDADCVYSCFDVGDQDQTGCWTCLADGSMDFAALAECDDGDTCTYDDICRLGEINKCEGTKKKPWGSLDPECQRLEPGCPVVPGIPSTFAQVVEKEGWCLFKGTYNQCVEQGDSPTNSPCKLCEVLQDGKTGLINITDFMECSDNDESTLGDYCRDGVCIPGVKKLCPVPGAEECASYKLVDGECTKDIVYHKPGFCVAKAMPGSGSTHVCVAHGVLSPTNACEACVASSGLMPKLAPVTNGVTCPGMNCCYSSGTCVDGTCKGSAPVECTLDECNYGVCMPSKCGENGLTDACQYMPKPTDGALGAIIKCETRCGTVGQCSLGECVSDSCQPTDCTAGPCDDGDPCTVNEQCVEGYCLPGEPLDCLPSTPCRIAFCDPVVGGCIEQNSAAGTSCDTDGNKCTLEQCDGNGSCIMASQVQCTTPLDGCQFSACVPATGECLVTHFPNGLPCDDGDACSLGASCLEGACQPTGFVQCPDDMDDCLDSYCEQGVCKNSPKPALSICSDGNLKTDDDACNALGECVTNSAPGGQLKYAGSNACQTPTMELNGQGMTIALVIKAALTGPDPYEVLFELTSGTRIYRFCVATAQIKPTSLGVPLSKGQLFVVVDGLVGENPTLLGCKNGYGNTVDKWDVVALTVDANGVAKLIGNLSSCEVHILTPDCELPAVTWPSGLITLRVGGSMQSGVLANGFHGLTETIGVFAEALPLSNSPFSISCFRNEGRDYSDSMAAVAVYKLNELSGGKLVSGTGKYHADLNSIPGVSAPQRVKTGEAFPTACQ